ncbi:MAG: DUF4262 domain-containing protein [Pseudomonadota bacterium]
MRTFEECSNEYERTLVARIAEGQWQITSVFGTKEDPITFAYTIGLTALFDHPEILTIGPDSENAAHYLNSCAHAVKEQGKVFAPQNFYPNILVDLQIFMTEASLQAREEYTLSCNWFYGGTDYPLLQCIWPSNKGFWPWDEHAWDDYKSMQPVYGMPPSVN